MSVHVNFRGRDPQGSHPFVGTPPEGVRHPDGNLPFATGNYGSGPAVQPIRLQTARSGHSGRRNAFYKAAIRPSCHLGQSESTVACAIDQVVWPQPIHGASLSGHLNDYRHLVARSVRQRTLVNSGGLVM